MLLASNKTTEEIIVLDQWTFSSMSYIVLVV